MEVIMHVPSVLPVSSHTPRNSQPPAQAARDILGTRTDLADQPFGKLVSMIARGEPIPSTPSYNTSNDTPVIAAPIADAPASDPAGGI
jgi:hypothetical protein